MQIEIKLDESIKGFEYTGEFRVPNQNDWCLINGLPMRRVHLALTDGDFVLEDSEGENITLNYIAEFPILRKLKPKQTLEDRVKAEYPRFDVAMCSPVVWYEVDFTGFKRGEKHWSTFEAQGMKGFYVYVYIIQSEIDDGEIDFYTSREPTEPYDILEDVKTIHPIAVLFTRDGE